MLCSVTSAVKLQSLSAATHTTTPHLCLVCQWDPFCGPAALTAEHCDSYTFGLITAAGDISAIFMFLSVTVFAERDTSLICQV